MTSEFRKFPKTPFCHFSFFRNSYFCDLRSKLRGLKKMTHLIKFALKSRTCRARDVVQKRGAITPILWKTPLYSTKFQMSINRPFDNIESSFLSSCYRINGPVKTSAQIFFFLISLIRYKIKTAKHIFSK